jgi:hypothetical protein
MHFDRLIDSFTWKGKNRELLKVRKLSRPDVDEK